MRVLLNAIASKLFPKKCCILSLFQEAHVAIGAITITAKREQIVDFSKPFMDFKIRLLMPKPTEEELNLFGFLLPFEMDVWLSTIAVVSYRLLKVVLYFSNRYDADLCRKKDRNCSITVFFRN